MGASADHSAEEFASWVEPHLTAMARLASRLAGPADRDDVVQEALIRAWRRRHTYDHTRGAPLAWLLAIVASCARRNRSRAAREQPARDAASQNEITDADRDRGIDIERALRTLPPRGQLAVALYYFVGLDIAQTAAVMECAQGTVKATLHQARARLRVQLGGEA